MPCALFFGALVHHFLRCKKKLKNENVLVPCALLFWGRVYYFCGGDVASVRPFRGAPGTAPVLLTKDLPFFLGVAVLLDLRFFFDCDISGVALSNDISGAVLGS